MCHGRWRCAHAKTFEWSIEGTYCNMYVLKQFQVVDNNWPNLVTCDSHLSVEPKFVLISDKFIGYYFTMLSACFHELL